MALTGRNGAGKSTFMAVASGRLLPNRGGGCVLLDGHHTPNRARGAAACRRILGLCPQTITLVRSRECVCAALPAGDVVQRGAIGHSSRHGIDVG